MKTAFEEEGEKLAQLIMHSVDKIHAWVFIATDSEGYPSLYTNISSMDEVHQVLIRLGRYGMENVTNTEEIKMETKQ